DENSQLLPYLARGLHLRTAYLSATRGDGGQNLIGNEQYEALGILRTEELLAARRLDGAEQYFAQAYDFGFSKSAEETLEKWGREGVLSDFVRVIRTFRPDIIITAFSGTASDGHGHHQSSGILAREAFRAAADPNRFPAQIQQGLKPWQASKLFWNVFVRRGGEGSDSEGVEMRLDEFDFLYGRTYAGIGQEARSMHRSQGMGGGGGRSPVALFRLVDSAPNMASGGRGLFDEIDLTLNRFTKLAGGSATVARHVEAIQKAVESARRMLSPTEPARILPALAEGLDHLHELRRDIDQGAMDEETRQQALFLLDRKEGDFVRAITLAGGVQMEALADKGEIVAGETFSVTLSAVVPAQGPFQGVGATLEGPPGWKIQRLAASDSGHLETKFQVVVPADAPVSQPYWLLRPRTRDYFPPPEVAWIGAAQNPAILKGNFQFQISTNGKTLPIEQQADVVFRFGDRVYGQREKPLTVVPSVAVWLEPEATIFPAGSRQDKDLMVRVRNHAQTRQEGTIRLELPPGWRSEPAEKPFVLEGLGDELPARFEVFEPDSQLNSERERHPVKAVAQTKEASYSTGYQVVDYPHIQPRYWFRPAVADLVRFDVQVAPNLKVGYVMGSGDAVPEALKQLGVVVEPLGPEALTFTDLSRYDAIVTGIRAYELRKDLVSNHARLMDYVRNGGVMIVQYSRTGGYSEPLGPYPMKLGASPRVAVEEAPVEILEPSHPVFHFPNTITENDFAGWVQERGTYFMESWDSQYQPLLTSHDPGEPPQKGGMLLASYGKGYYLYTGYVWFRQLPAGVPGAYRIFANLISLGKAPARSSPTQ
ncbi:MAG: PIG-L family deacetylase, partial [Acidobacteria bacterium]|nr:PIG-L family deacetylase [Acidobacteriota bacterium]